MPTLTNSKKAVHQADQGRTGAKPQAGIERFPGSGHGRRPDKYCKQLYRDAGIQSGFDLTEY